MNAWIEMTNLKKQVDDFHLGPIDLTIEPGTITALVGNNGSGKSTMLKLMMNMVSPDTGSIRIFDKSVHGHDEEWKTKVAYQPQAIIGWDAYTGNTLKTLISQLYPNWDGALFNRIVDLFDVDLRKKFGKLSQGAQQKLSLALTIPRETPLLLLDEPTSFLDIPSKKHLLDILVDWMDEEERSIVITSHQAEDIRKLADYLFVLQDGKMIGNFEKEALTESFRRYWISSTLPDLHIPGEVSRKDLQLVSNDPAATEKFLQENSLQLIDQRALELEEIITLLLKRKDD